MKLRCEIAHIETTPHHVGINKWIASKFDLLSRELLNCNNATLHNGYELDFWHFTIRADETDYLELRVKRVYEHGSIIHFLIKKNTYAIKERTGLL